MDHRRAPRFKSDRPKMVRLMLRSEDAGGMYGLQSFTTGLVAGR